MKSVSVNPSSVRQWVGIILVCLAGNLTSGCQGVEKATATPGPPPHEVLTEELRDYQVVSADGEVIGAVDGLVVGTEDAEVVYVVVRIDDIYAFGKGGGAPQDRFLLIPWSHVTLDASQHRLIADVGSTVLDAAPILSDLPQPATMAWDEAIRNFWAEQ